MDTSRILPRQSFGPGKIIQLTIIMIGMNPNLMILTIQIHPHVCTWRNGMITNGSIPVAQISFHLFAKFESSFKCNCLCNSRSCISMKTLNKNFIFRLDLSKEKH